MLGEVASAGESCWLVFRQVLMFAGVLGFELAVDADLLGISPAVPRQGAGGYFSFGGRFA
jgi:hypothetical protein